MMAGKKPVAVLISLTDIDEESFWLSMSPKFASILEQSRQEIRSGKKLSLAEVKQIASTWDSEGKNGSDEA
ncbi:MAG: hypothetical protein U0350_12770 [Caldilineaceae bacterium]